MHPSEPTSGEHAILLDEDPEIEAAGAQTGACRFRPAALILMINCDLNDSFIAQQREQFLTPLCPRATARATPIYTD